MTRLRPVSELQRRLLPLQISMFFQGFMFWYAIEKAFMVTIGFNDESIAFVTSIYIVVLLVANFPVGVLADRWSRKGVLLLSSCMLVLASYICGISHGIWMYALGTCIWGLFFAGYNGTYDSIVYDVVTEERAPSGSFEKYYGRQQLVYSIALLTSALASSAIVSRWGLRSAYFITIPFTCLSFVSLALFREPTLHKQAVAVPVFKHVKSIYTSLAYHVELRWLVAGMVCAVVASRLIFEFMTLWLIGLRMPITLFGPSTALFFVGMGAGGYLARHLVASRAKLLVFALLALFFSLVLTVRVRVLVIPGTAALICALMVITIMTSRLLHDAVSSKVRAGVSSLVTSIGFGMFLPVAIGFGIISRDYNVFHGGWFEVGSAIGLFLFLSGYVLFARRSNPMLEAGAADSAV